MRGRWGAATARRDAGAESAVDRLAVIVEQGLAANSSATEAVVHAARLSSRGPGVCVMDGGLSEDAVHAMLMKACGEAPWGSSVLGDACRTTSYSLDGATYCVDARIGGDTRVRCWDERCLEMVVDESLGVAVSFQRREARPPTLFSSRAEVHHSESVERLTVPMGDSATLVIESAGGTWRAKAVVTRGAPRIEARRSSAVILAGAAPRAS